MVALHADWETRMLNYHDACLVVFPTPPKVRVPRHGVDAPAAALRSLFAEEGKRQRKRRKGGGVKAKFPKPVKSKESRFPVEDSGSSDTILASSGGGPSGLDKDSSADDVAGTQAHGNKLDAWVGGAAAKLVHVEEARTILFTSRVLP